MHPFWVFLILLGVAQGVFLAFALWFKKKNRPANRLLSLLLAAVSLHLTEYALAISGLTLRWPHAVASTYPLLFVVGPLFWFYANALLRPPFHFSKKQLWHLLPALLCLLLFVPFYLLPAEAKIAFLENLPKEGYMDLPPEQAAVMFAQIAQLVVYAWFAWRLVQRENAELRHSRSNGALLKLDWLLAATKVFWAFLVVYGVVFTVIVFQKNYRVEMDYGVVVLMAGLIFAIAWAGLMQPAIFANGRTERKTAVVPAGDLEHLKTRLLAFLENEKPWQREELRLQEVAEKLDIPAHQLSEVISTGLKTNFFDLINSCRVEAAKRLLADPKMRDQKILAIAFDTGFGNKATFYRVFKKFTGATPTEFREKF